VTTHIIVEFEISNVPNISNYIWVMYKIYSWVRRKLF